jgi:hypothetical protein
MRLLGLIISPTGSSIAVSTLVMIPVAWVVCSWTLRALIAHLEVHASHTVAHRRTLSVIALSPIIHIVHARSYLKIFKLMQF